MCRLLKASVKFPLIIHSISTGFFHPSHSTLSLTKIFIQVQFSFFSLLFLSNPTLPLISLITLNAQRRCHQRYTTASTGNVWPTLFWMFEMQSKWVQTNNCHTHFQFPLMVLAFVFEWLQIDSLLKMKIIMNVSHGIRESISSSSNYNLFYKNSVFKIRSNWRNMRYQDRIK